MERCKRILLRVFMPPVPLVLLFFPLAAALLIYAFVAPEAHPAAVYGAYFFSAYTLVAVCMRVPAVYRAARGFEENNAFLQRYLHDVQYRMKLTLRISLLTNVLYAFMQLFLGLYVHSIWYYALAAYYTLLAMLRWMLYCNVARGDLGKNRLAELRRYRFCGWILLLINQALAVIVVFIVWQNRGFTHHEITTIVLAVFSFYSMTMAIINLIRFRKYRSPILSAAKVLSLTSALVSILSLETAMIHAFGAENNPVFRRVMTALTGGAVCLVVLALAIGMIVTSTKEIRSIKQGEKNHE